jgi:hypothetical protein
MVDKLVNCRFLDFFLDLKMGEAFHSLTSKGP